MKKILIALALIPTFSLAERITVPLEQLNSLADKLLTKDITNAIAYGSRLMYGCSIDKSNIDKEVTNIKYKGDTDEISSWDERWTTKSCRGKTKFNVHMKLDEKKETDYTIQEIK